MSRSENQRRAVCDLPGRSHDTPRAARHFITAQLARWRITGEDAQAAVLIASELATNAVQHAKGPRVLVSVMKTGPYLTLSVTDRGGRPTNDLYARVPDLNDEGGRGLYLVEALTEKWQASPTDTGTTVCALLALAETEDRRHRNDHA